MEDKRTALALLICIMIVMVYTQTMFPQQTRVIQAPQQQEQQQNNTQLSPTIPANNQVVSNSQNQLPKQEQQIATKENRQSAGFIKVETPLFTVTISKLGGRIEKLELKKYFNTLEDKKPYDLVEIAADQTAPLGIYFDNNNSDEGVLYSANSDSFNLTENTSIELVGTHPITGQLKKVISLSPNSYLFKVEVSAERLPENIALEWSHTLLQSDTQKRLDPIHFTALLADENVKNTLTAKLQPQTIIDQGQVKWSAIADKYFTATIIPGSQIGAALLGTGKDYLYTKVYTKGTPATFSVYAGPKDFEQLEQFETQKLTRGIDLGFFSFLAQPLLKLLKFFESFLGNYGLAIILLTLVVKLCFLPLTKISFKSMQAMQELSPEIQSLRERVKDATKLNQEIMELYKRKGVNPMGGCFPILVQIPVFFGLYSALLHSFDLRHASFALWIKDLSAPERLDLFGINFPLLILLMGGSMIYQQWTTPTPGMDPTQRKMMKMMPIIFTVMFIIFPMPSGLVLYWLVNNIISITQQLYLKGHKKADPLTATLAVSAVIFGIGYALTLL